MNNTTHIISPHSTYPDQEDFLDLGMSETGPYALLWVEEKSEPTYAGIFLGPEELRTLAAKALELAEDLEDVATAVRVHAEYLEGRLKTRLLSDFKKELDL